MGFFDRLSRLLRANLNDLVSKAEDPAKILDQSVADMQDDLVKLRQAVATAIASQKRIQNQAEQSETQARTWYERAELALKKGEEDLAREALSRRKTYQDTAAALNAQLQAQAGQVDTLKKSLVALEGKIAEAKTKKDMLKARSQAAKAQEQLQSAVGSLGTNSAMAAFERMRRRCSSRRPAARPPPSWPAPIWRASSRPCRAAATWTMSLRPCATGSRAALPRPASPRRWSRPPAGAREGGGGGCRPRGAEALDRQALSAPPSGDRPAGRSSYNRPSALPP